MKGKNQKPNWPLMWTVGELLGFFEDEAKKYRKGSVDSVMRNCHMNELSPSDIKKIRLTRQLFQRFGDAILVDFINFIARGQGGDLGLAIKHLKGK